MELPYLGQERALPAAANAARPVGGTAAGPDKGHGTFQVVGTPANTRIVDLPVLAGRWLQPGDDDVVVLNHMAAAAAPGGKVGSSVTISVDREPHVWRVVGIVRDLGSPATAYVSSGTFARITHTTGTTLQLGVSTGSQDSAHVRTSSVAWSVL